MNMVLTGLIAGICTFLAVSLGGFLLYVIIKRSIKGHIDRYFSAPDDKTPSPFATMVNTLAILFVQHLVAHVKGSINGMLSADSRAAGKEADAGNPIIAALAAVGLPKKLAKSIGGNPVVSQLITEKLSQYLSKKSLTGGNGQRPRQTILPLE